MDHMEMVEKLRQKANVSYEEAKEALEKADWDILDALVMLEGDGKIKGEAPAPEYTTQEKKAPQQTERRVDFESAWSKLWNLVKRLFQKGNANQFVVSRNGKEVLAMPVTVIVLLALLVLAKASSLWFIFFVLIPGFVVSMAFGVRYSFRGPNITARMNETMNSAQDKAANIIHVQNDDQNKVE